jgi:GntR family transcriptional regulator, transcriptional repressor for pyruvate dehydrogenase complex
MEIAHIPFPASGTAGLIGQNRASDNAVDFLRSLIFSGQLGPSDKLPPERELAKLLGISTLTLRAALRSLETSRFLTVKLGSRGGWWVNDAEAVSRCWNQWMREHQHQLDDLLEFMRMVEINVASLAAERSTPEDIEALEHFRAGADEEWKSIVRWHSGFHGALARAAHNQYLESSVHSIRGELFLPVQQAISEHRIAEIQSMHDRIISAVRDRDPARAAAEMGRHLEFTERLFESADWK